MKKNFNTLEEELHFIIEDPHNIKEISYPSKEAQVLSISYDDDSIMGYIGYIENPCEDAEVLSIKHNIKALDFLNINNICEEAQILAINNSPHLIKNINEPSENLQFLSILENIDNVKYIKKPTKKIIKYIYNNTDYEYFVNLFKEIPLEIQEELLLDLISDIKCKNKIINNSGFLHTDFSIENKFFKIINKIDKNLIEKWNVLELIKEENL